MNTKKIILALAAGCALSATAQEATRTAYFLDGYTYRHELNPAFAGDHNYISIPILSNINVGLQSNVGLNTFLYKTQPGSQYKLTTFMSPTVDADDFLGKLKDSNNINTNIDLSIFSFGFKGFKGFNTVSVGIHTDVGMCLPKDLFAFMKLGQTGDETRYSFDDLSVNANAYAEVALGHSHKINDKLNIGAKVKFLFGVGNVSAKISNMDVVLSNKQWHVNATGEMQMAAGSGLIVPTKHEAGTEYTNPNDADLIEWDDIDYDSFGLSGFGVGVDLGATYQLLPNLQLSAAINDIGYMNWKNAVTAKTGTTEWTFDGFQDVAFIDKQPGYEDNKIDEQFDHLWDDLQDAVNFHRESTDGSYSKALHATLRLGAEYGMPFYNNLTAGFLFSSYFAGPQSWQEGRFYLNIKPVKWFNATVNYGASTFGSSLGWMLNFHPKGINFFVGTDCQFLSVTPQYVPVGNANVNVNLGFNVAL